METILSTALADRIQKATGENVFQCYQCVKCTSGCPVAEHFDLAPNQVMRAAQLGLEDMVFASKTPWLCASCQTCSSRCPQGIDVARVMDYIVGEATAAGTKPPVKSVADFNKVFLRNVNLLGRSYELGLLVEMNMRAGKPLNDIDLGLKMFQHRKISLLPKVVRKHRRRAPLATASRPANEVGYYPGCSLHSTAKEFDRSTRSTLEALGITPVEPEGWVCCGSTPSHRVDHHLATRLPLETLILLEQDGLKQVTLPCAACFNRFRAAARDLRLEPDLKAELEREIGHSYNDSVEITSTIDLFLNTIGLEAIAARVRKPLSGLRMVCYYGCLLTRPPEVTGAEQSEYPMGMDRMMRTLGATVVDWDRKVACCGGALSLTRKDVILELSRDILDNAKARGADVIAVACPLCHANLDARQTQMADAPKMPVLYFTQLAAVAFGMPEQASLDRNLIDPRPLLTERSLV